MSTRRWAVQGKQSPTYISNARRPAAESPTRVLPLKPIDGPTTLSSEKSHVLTGTIFLLLEKDDADL